MLRTFAWLAAASSALWLSTALALGLGEIDVKSKLNQRFLATIPLTSVAADEAENILVNLASNDDFARAGIDRAEYLSSLSFTVKTDEGTPRIVITSKQIAREPFLSFLLDVRGKSGRILREYTVLLDPPEFAQTAKPATAVAKPEAKPAAPAEFYETPEESAKRAMPAEEAEPAPAASADAATAPVSEQAAAVPEESTAAAAPISKPAAAGSYGPVQPKETLWSIATKLRPDPSISMDQVLLALYNSNPKAFDSNFQGLRKGSVLSVPSAEQMRAISPAAAKARVAELRGAKPPPKTGKAATQQQAIPRSAAEAMKEEAPASAAAAKPAADKAGEAKIPAPAPAEKKTEGISPPPTPPSTVSSAVDTQPQTKTEAAPSQPPNQTAGAGAQAAITETASAPVPAPLAESATTIPPAPHAPAATPTPPVPAEAPKTTVVSPPSSTAEQSAGLLDGLPDLLLPAGGAVALILASFFGWRYWRKKQAAKKSLSASAAVKEVLAAAGKVPSKTVYPSLAATQFGDETEQDKLFAEAAADHLHPAAKVPESAPVKTADRTQKVESTMAMTVPDLNATQIVEAPAAKTVQSTAAPASERVDFDVTSQFAAETMSINLDANDPISEADFHLAYGLYDEAALLLKQAAEKEPGRPELRVKLAETYFAATKPAEFQQVAETLKNQLPGAEWQKLAIMGRQLCPDAAIFKGGDDNDTLSGNVDLAFDEPSEAVAAIAELAPMGGKQPASSSLDFKLQELELPQIEEPKLDVSAADDVMDFKLDRPAQDAKADATPNLGTENFDLSDVFESKPATSAATQTDEGVEIRLDDFDLGADNSTISGGDEAGTKLDLARAYVDMGDNDMARSLLNEVLHQGSADQKKEAEALIGRLA